jgi:hypothetical protein
VPSYGESCPDFTRSVSSEGVCAMADGLILDGPSEDLDVFECPKCKETIDTSADVCRFCGAKVDHEAAQKAAHLLARVDQACSDASVLRNTAVIAFLLVLGIVYSLLRAARLVLVFGFQNEVLGISALVLILSAPFPIWSLRWWSKYTSLTSDDEDFQDARVTVRSTGSTALAFAAASGALFCVVLILKLAHQ